MVETLPLSRPHSRNSRRLFDLLLMPLAIALGACSADENGDPCALKDQDGIIGGTDVFVVRIRDAGFEPIILSAQNQSDVTLTLHNESSGEAGFLVDCLPTPNGDGCAQQSCFPSEANVPPLAPGESATVQFRLPEVEGEYVYRARAGDDARTGQFILQ